MFAVGVSATGFVGQADATGSANVDAVGVQGTGQVGQVAVNASANVFVIGVSATGFVGQADVTGSANVSVTGVEGTGFVGSVAVTGGAVVQPTGVSGSGAVGSVTVTGGASVPVTGVQGNGEIGQVIVIQSATVNAHCGEGGLFGDEDDTQIAPAVAAARAEGIDAHGPIPADTVFHRAYQGAFDLIVAQYHDQGHIPIKLVAFDTAVNVSLGLPIDRCSVDHGTAFDIAGKGIAKNVNLDHALAYARRMAATRRPA